MRFVLLAFIFLLILTLGNAWLLHQGAPVAAAHDNAPLQIGSRSLVQQEWEAFVWREIAAAVLTILLFGAIATAARRASRSRSGSSSRLR